MTKEQIFRLSEKRVIGAMYQLDRWATSNEISEWADGMSWNTANAVLKILETKKIVKSKKVRGRVYWRMIGDE